MVSKWSTDKAFRGQVNENDFKIISSEIGRGALCVLIGKFEGRKGEIEVRINKAFKIMFAILLSYPFIGFGIIAYLQGIDKAIQFIPILIAYLLFIRLAFIELSFRYVSKTGLKKLDNILGLKA